MSKRHGAPPPKPTDDEVDDDDAPAGKVRIDKWLWAARFFKTRSLAQEAVDGGKAEVNGEKAKRAKLVQAGDKVRLRNGAEIYELNVLDIASRRGSAEIAQSLYEEDNAGKAKRELVREQTRNMNTGFMHDDNRPSKRDRREIRRFKDH